MRFTHIIYLTLSIFFSALSSLTAESIKWSEDFPNLPDEHGFAGGYAGIVGEKDDRYLVFGGGANFPYKNPFDAALNDAKQQPKVWHNSLYAIKLKPDSLTADGDWKKLDITLPAKIGYGGSVTHAERKSALFVGGHIDGGKTYSDAVYEVTVKSGEFEVKKVASLPVGVGYSAAEIVKEKLYVVSGKSENGYEAKAWVIDVSQEDTADWKAEEISWPDFGDNQPATARGFSTLGSQGDKLYFIGGRTSHHPDKPLAIPVAESDAISLNSELKLSFHRDCYVLSPNKDPKKSSWKRIADLPKGISAAPSRAVPSGYSHLALIGGGSVETLIEVRDKSKHPNLNAGGQGFDHPGFPHDILAYHSITDSWVKMGEIPATSKSPVTAPVVITGGATNGYEFLVVSGEWSPKLRTNAVLSAKLKKQGASFGIVNWIVVVIYLLGMVGIGYWFMKKEAATSTDDYFRGGQRIPWWVAGLSIFATVLSSITFMAIPALSYKSDWNKWVGQWPILVIIPLVVFFYLPFFRKLNLTSAYEYLEARFNLAIRLIASASFMIFHVGRIAIVLYLPALALSSVTDINIYFAIAVIGLLCVIYTVMGGIEAVVWTDAIQAMVLIGGALLCFFLVVANVDGGFGAITETLSNKSKFLNVDWSMKEAANIGSGTKSGWLFFFGFLFAALPNYTSGQDVVQRYVTTPTEKEAARSLWMNIFMTLVGSAIFFALGTALYVYYNANPVRLDPTMSANDGILPFYIMQNLPIGVSGLIVAGVFAAAQSTISSSLNSLATAFVTDYYGRVISPQSSDKQRLKVARNVVISIGIVGVLTSIWVANQELKSAFDTFNMFVGFILGPLAAMFALGVFTKRVSGKACLIGSASGSLAIIAITILNKQEVIDVWSLLNGLICFVVTFVIAYIASFVFPATAEKTQGLTIHSK